MRIGSLFSGIGGLELGLELSGLGHTVWQVEQNKFCRQVLAKHWPNVRRYGDVKEVGEHNLEPVDVICGGFPCQDISSAGKGAGLAGERSGLWREYARIIGEIKPEWVVVENVASGARRWVDAVVRELGQFGYEVLPIPLSARDVGAPHRRERIFVIANTERVKLRQQPRRGSGTHRQGAAFSPEPSETRGPADTNSKSVIPEYAQVEGMPRSAGFCGWSGGPFVAPVCRVDDGIPRRMDRLRSLGNAVVPQCAEVIGHAIRELAEV